MTEANTTIPVDPEVTQPESPSEDSSSKSTGSSSGSRRGPKTEEGKRRVSLNALKHGLYAKAPQATNALNQMAGADYFDLLDKVRTQYWPIDQIEDMLCKRIARCLWRLGQMESMEERLFELHSDRTKPGAAYESVLRTERMVSLELHRCFRSFAQKRDADRKANPGVDITKSDSCRLDQPYPDLSFEEPRRLPSIDGGKWGREQRW